MDMFLTCLLATLEDYQADLCPLMIAKDVLIFLAVLKCLFSQLMLSCGVCKFKSTPLQARHSPVVASPI